MEEKRRKQADEEQAKEGARLQLITNVLGLGIPHVGPPYVDRLGGNLFVLNRLDLKTVLRKVRISDEVIEEAAAKRNEQEPEEDIKQRLFKLALPFYGREKNIEKATDTLCQLARMRKIWTPPCPQMVDRGQNARNDRALLRGLAEASQGDTHFAASMLDKMVKWEYQMRGRIQVPSAPTQPIGLPCGLLCVRDFFPFSLAATLLLPRDSLPRCAPIVVTDGTSPTRPQEHSFRSGRWNYDDTLPKLKRRKMEWYPPGPPEVLLTPTHYSALLTPTSLQVNLDVLIKEKNRVRRYQPLFHSHAHACCRPVLCCP